MARKAEAAFDEWLMEEEISAVALLIRCAIEVGRARGEEGALRGEELWCDS